MEQRGRSFCMFGERSDPLPLYAIHPSYPSTFLHIFLSIPPPFFLSRASSIESLIRSLVYLPPPISVFLFVPEHWAILW